MIVLVFMLSQYYDESGQKKSATPLNVNEELGEELFGLVPGFLIDAIADARTFNLSFDEPDPLQLGEMLRDCSLGKGKLLDDVAADAGILSGEEFQY
jgi:hypothetical protein